MTTDVDLFDERESLSRIRDYARQRMVAPIAVMLGVLLRVATAAPAHVMIPKIIGTPKPLNLVVVTVGPSGLGKTASDDVGEQYMPADIPVYPFGTAEGTVQAFEPDEDGNPQVPNIIFASSEIDNWAALGERAGSMTFPVLRQIVTGDQLGQKNASKANTRVVNKRSYRAGISLSAQPESKGAAILFADAPGGFPQRCLFGPATDPDAPDEPPTGVEPFKPDRVPDFTPNAGDYYEIPFPESVATEIRDHRRRVLRGDPDIDPLDGHRNLTQAKVAAALMLLEGRQEVTEDDWRVAGRIMAMSDTTRALLISSTQQAARIANRARALASADRDEVVASTKLQRTKHTLWKHLAAKGDLPRHELRKRLRSDQREYFDAAISELSDEERLFATTTDGTTIYQVALEPAQESTWTESPRLNSQVNGRGPKVHVDRTATVMDLDTRRSSTRPHTKVSGRQWFYEHIASLQNSGQTTVTSLAVYRAGQAAGYGVNNLRQAASGHPDVVVTGKAGRALTWSIEPQQRSNETSA